jgi:Dyp-type peroxidase family
VRGRISNTSGSYLTPRYENETQGNPGQDLVWPGEFVFGEYPTQKLGDETTKGINSIEYVGEKSREFAEDGSFLVFRRLKQDVGAFHSFLHKEAQKRGMDLNPDRLGAQCVGRWASGAPILRARKQDNANWAEDDSKNNDFMFSEDFDGEVCPYASHIRKMYPRDDISKSAPQSLSKSITQTHRLLRRGIPYGEPSLSSPTAPLSDTVDRGLLFLAYQTSIERQFEFLQKEAANNPNFKELGAGYDPIIGQNNKGDQRTFRITENGQPVELPPDRWVTPKGGGYFFAPSIKALQLLTNLKRELPPKVITPEVWAQIWADAWLKEKSKKEEDKEFITQLRTNPAKAARTFQKNNRLPDYDKLVDLDGRIYKKPFHQGLFEGMSFSTMSPKDLQEIVEKGTLHSKPFCVQPSEWVIVRKKN